MMRKFVMLLTVLLAGVNACFAQSNYPDRSITILVGYAPGSSTDIVSRLIADKMSRDLGQTVIVENIQGAGGLLAVQRLLRAAPDGYTLLTFNPGLAGIIPALYKTPPYDSIKDFTHIGTMSINTGRIIAVNPRLPAKTFQEFVKLAKSTPKLLNYGTYGVGSVPHLEFEALKAKLGIDMVHVPYKGGAVSYQAAIAGEVDVVAGISFIELIESGRLRALAIGGSARSSQLPEIPTLAELGLGQDMFGDVYTGLSGPAGMTAPVVDKLSAELKRILALPDIVEKVGKFSEATYRTPDQYKELVRRNVVFYGPLVKSLGLSTN